MAKFTDKLKREWLVELDLVVLDEIKRDTGVDLDAMTGSAADREAFGELLLGNRGRKLVEVLWVMVRDQAEKLGVTPEEFPRGFTGPVFEEAQRAFLEALVDFSPRQVVARTLKSHLPDLMRKMDRVLETATTKWATETLAEPESTSSPGATGSPASPALPSAGA